MAWTHVANIKGETGATGPEGPQGLPGTGAVPADEAVAGYVSTEGTSATKDALEAGFVRKLGSRGTERRIYVRATGPVNGDGKTVETAFREIKDAVASLDADGPTVRGSVVIDVGGGTYKGGIRLPLARNRSQDDFIKIVGPDVLGHPNVPSVIIDHEADTAATWGILAEDGASLWLQDIKFKGGFPIAVRCDRNVLLQWRNVHVDGRDSLGAVVGSVGLALNSHCRYYVTGGIIEQLLTNGVQELFHVTRAYNTVASNAGQLLIRNCEVGFQAKENCVGHLDYLNVEDCLTGVEFNGLCVTNVKSISLKRNGLGLANINSEVHNEGGIQWGTGADKNTRDYKGEGNATLLSAGGWVDSATARTSAAGHPALRTMAVSVDDVTVTGVTTETTFYSLTNAVRPHLHNTKGQRIRVVVWGSVNSAITTAAGYRILLRIGPTLIGEVRVPQTAAVGDDFEARFDIISTADGDAQKVFSTITGYPARGDGYATRTLALTGGSAGAAMGVAVSAIPGATSESVTLRMMEVWG